MQIREAYQDFKDIRRDILESDPERDEIEPKHKRKVSFTCFITVVFDSQFNHIGPLSIYVSLG